MSLCRDRPTYRIKRCEYDLGGGECQQHNVLGNVTRNGRNIETVKPSGDGVVGHFAESSPLTSRAN